MKKAFLFGVIGFLALWWGLFGCGGGSKGEKDRASLTGTVLYQDKKDTVYNGFAKISYRGMPINSGIIQGGRFYFNGLATGSGFRLVIEDGKNGMVLGVDSSLELDEGENLRTLFINRFIDTSAYIGQDTTSRGKLKVDPKKDH